MSSCRTAIPFLIFPFYLKSSKVLLNLNLLNTFPLIISLILTNLLTLSTTPLKLLCSTFIIILLVLLAHRKHLVFVFLTSLQSAVIQGSHRFRFKCNNFSSCHSCAFKVQFLVFILYTTPLRTLYFITFLDPSPAGTTVFRQGLQWNAGQNGQETTTVGNPIIYKWVITLSHVDGRYFSHDAVTTRYCWRTVVETAARLVDEWTNLSHRVIIKLIPA